jgi:hypothetical protein
MAIEIRLLKESEYKEANDLYNRSRHIDRAAPTKPRTYPEFCWEFLDCPNGKAIYAGAWETEDGKEPLLIGTQCMIIFKMMATDGRHILTAKGEGTLIDIKAMMRHRKADILGELLGFLEEECKKAGAEFIWGFNNIPASYKRLGYENPFKSHHGICILKPIKAYKNLSSLKTNNSLKINIKTALLAGLAYFFSWKKISIASSKSPHNTEINENGSLFKNTAGLDPMFFLLQDKNYLDWRISKNPYPIRYRSFQLLENTLLLAQVICSIQKDVAFIEQTLFDKKITKKNRLSLLKRIVHDLQKENVCIIRYTGFNNNTLNASEMELLKRLGFVFTGKGDWFTFKNLSANATIKPEMIYLSRMYKQGVN